MNTKIIILLVFSVFLSSCSSTKLSTKELSEFTSGKKAIFKTYNQPLIGALIFEEQPVTQIIAVDGKNLESEIFITDEKIVVDIGLHKIKLSCVNRSSSDERDYTEVIEIVLKPHYEYIVRCSFDTEFGPDGTYTGSFSVKEKQIK